MAAKSFTLWFWAFDCAIFPSSTSAAFDSIAFVMKAESLWLD